MKNKKPGLLQRLRNLFRAAPAKPVAAQIPMVADRPSVPTYGGSVLRNWALSGEDGEGRAFEIQLSQAQLGRHKYGLTVGRHDQLCEIALDHTNLSRRHARFMLRDGSLAVEDLNSANGSMVDGRILKPFQPAVLSDGSAVVLADIRLQVSSSGK